jgi:type VI secretion system secreted protein VgrG
LRAGRIEVELSVGQVAAGDVAVTRVQGREGLSEPYGFAVELVPRAGEPIDLDALVGAEGELTLRRNTGEERVIHGECHRIELVGVAAGVPSYRVTIRPRLARLGAAARSRIFQGKSVPEIVAAVLDEHGVAHRRALAGSYAARELTAQYRETDLAFVSRLLEAEGIWYRFEHGPGRHELVLGDAPSAYVDGGVELPVLLGGGTADETEHVARVERECRAVVGAVALRDYDFERPALALDAREGTAEGPEVYEPAPVVVEGGAGERARRRLEGLRHGTETWAGKGNGLGVVPGSIVGLEERGRVLVVRVTHGVEQELSAGAAGERRARYENAFEGIEAGRAYRPRRATPRPRIRGIQTARVVGPAGEEVHTDRYGRVKVQLHWDRDGANDDRSSCWVRTAQAWAGAGMGASFVPRVGQEVVVRFLEGDPDRPLVTGAVFNGENPAPAALPQEKTRATLRTSTSPGGEGYNELTFEDAAGQEAVFLRAQRDEQVVVEDAHAAKVGANEGIAVAKDRSKTVAGAQTLHVSADDTAGVGGRRALIVAGARETHTGGNHTERVGLAQTVNVGGTEDVTIVLGSAVTIGAAAALSIGGGYAVNVGGVLNEAVGGMKSSQVGGAAVEIVGARRDERVAGERESMTGGDAAVDVTGGVESGVGGDGTETVSGKAAIGATDAVRIALAADGTLRADRVELVVGGKLLLSMDKGGAVTVSGSAVAVEGKAIAVKGGKVEKKTAGEAKSASVPPPDLAELGYITLVITDGEGLPARNVRYRAELPDGSKHEGLTDWRGRAVILSPAEGDVQLTIPDLDDTFWDRH